MASTYLKRSLGTATSNKKGTWSFWVKKSKNGASMMFFGNEVSNDNNRGYIQFNSSDKLRIIDNDDGGDNCQMITTQVFRDVNAWYHFVFAFDTTQSTASDRIKWYVNGEQITAFDTASYPAQNIDLKIFEGGQTNKYHIGSLYASGSGSNFFDGCMSHVHFSDGQQLAPTVFGSTDSTTGEWKINTSPSFTLGNNGFTILKDGITITDQSSNSNNFSLGGGTLTKTEDCPSNVFATLNPLDMYYGNSTLSNGNNTQNQSASSGNYAYIPSTLGFNSGKWYWEMKCVSGHSDNWYGTGITSSQVNANNNWLGQNANDYSLYGYSYGGGLGASYTGGTRTNQGLSFTAGDIIGVEVDCDNLAIYFSKNGTWMSNASSTQGVPTSGGSKTGSFYTITAPSSTTIGFYFPALCYYDAQNAVQQTNFGNGYFGTTAVSSAGTNASGIGIFEYDVPTGYTALSTKGLNL